MSKFKDLIESKQNSANQDAMIENLTKKFELEKKQTLQEYQSY
eukprot:gene20361-26426_t